MTGRYAGVELGGTKCLCVLGHPSGTILEEQVVPTTAPDETLGRIEQILSGWWSGGGFEALGIASFGPIDLDRASPTYGFMTATPKPGWRGIDIAPRLSRSFPVPYAFDTDVNGAAFAEIRWGAGQGLSDFAYITVGTGVGVGLIVNGRPTRGFAHCELGHIRVARPAGDTWTGSCPYHGDCVEGLISGPAIKSRLGGRGIAEVPADDPLWTLVAHTLAQLCHVLVCAAAPRRIVIGGGVVAGQPQLLGMIKPLLAESLAGYMPLPEGPYVTEPGLGISAGPLGPIALALNARLDNQSPHA